MVLTPAKIFVTRKILPDGMDLLKSRGIEVEVWSKDRPMNSGELDAAALSVQGLICTLSDSIDKTFLEKHSHLKVISNYAVGYNNIDIKTATRLNILVGNTPDVLTEATAELSLALMICAARNVRAGMKNVENGEWKYFEPQGFLGHGLQNKILGIIGMGRIGRRLSQMCQAAFNMEIRTYQKGKNLAEFLADLDVVSLHVPLNEETRNMISHKELNLMKRSAILINTSRGEVIDQTALHAALSKGALFAAGLDVTTPEPLAADHPLLSLPNVIILPHIASATYEARHAMTAVAAGNALEGLLRKEGFLERGKFVNGAKIMLK